MDRLIRIALGAILIVVGVFSAVFPAHKAGAVVAVMAVVLIALPSFAACIRWLGRGPGIGLIASLGAFAFAIETFGVVTGLPYGGFHYGSAIGPLLRGLVPVTLPMAYVPLVLAAAGLAHDKCFDEPRFDRPFRHEAAQETPSRRKGRLPTGACWVVWGTALLLAFDLVLDPGAVAVSYWTYVQNDAHYHGVPLSNYVGWAFSGSLAMLIALWWVRRTSPRTSAPPGLRLSAYLTMAYWTGVALWLHLAAPALIGLALMAILLPFRRSRSDSR